MLPDFSKIGLSIPQVLLPQHGVDLYKWAVVACDQFTAQPEYWQKVREITNGSPSTLSLIFPECGLGKGDEAETIQKIHQVMQDYLDEGLLEPQESGFVYVERRTDHSGLRKGLVVALDLEQYDYNPGAKTLVRATEGTVLERIPPRVRIREGAPVELPHVMVLIDDPECRLFEALSSRKENLVRLYETRLMMNGGQVAGYLVRDPEDLEEIHEILSSFLPPNGLLYAVGDGNHSLATAKAVWEKMKAEGTPPANHPARYALVELVNLHDDGLRFEPIHRVVFHTEPRMLLAEMLFYYQSAGAECKFVSLSDASALHEKTDAASGEQEIPFVTSSGYGKIVISNPPHRLEAGTLQMCLDEFLKQHPESEIDYIHGDKTVEELGSKPGNIGFILPPLNKAELFTSVASYGVLPRKTFSMGDAEEKRYYMECRRII